jgi:hypothetical protein
MSCWEVGITHFSKGCSKIIWPQQIKGNKKSKNVLKKKQNLKLHLKQHLKL